MKRTAFIWLVIVVLMLACGFLGYRWHVAQAQLGNAVARIADLTRIPTPEPPMQSALFVKADGKVLTYRLPEASQVGGQTFINYREIQTSYDASTIVIIGPYSSMGAAVLLKLPENTAVSLQAPNNNATGAQTVTSIYIPSTQ